MKPVRLRDLAGGLRCRQLIGDPDTLCTGLAHDSREVVKGDLFAAIPGMHSDGREHIPAALGRGAAAVLTEPPPLPGGGTQLLVASAREALPPAAELIYGRPDSDLPVVGITGTNGKTTIAYLIGAILEAAGYRPALVGSVESRYGPAGRMALHTTPEASTLHRFWAECRSQGADALVMEASSHGLLLHRTDRIGFNAALFTNLTRDHLDFHPDLVAYRGAKSRLFGLLPPGGSAILNADDTAWEAFAGASAARLTTYAVHAHATVRAEAVEVTRGGIRLRVVCGKRVCDIRSRLFGRFNVHNLLAAAAFGFARKLKPEAIAAGLESLAEVPGRAQRIECGQPFLVLNDFAHTPDALAGILTAARELTAGSLHLLFGCGGDRDRGKRPLMGRVAAERADFVTVTSDNPRSEDPQAIIRDITAAMGRGNSLVVEPDRALAIRGALARMRPDDTLIVAGKGHERYQIIGDARRHFDDAEVIQGELRAMGYSP